MRQLVLIDSLYTTNIKRMRLFAIEEICDDIWKLCNNGAGIHTLATLAAKIDATQPLQNSIATLFTHSYGYIKGEEAGKAASLISKYLFFVKVACPNDIWGFPIYDSIVNGLIYKLQTFLGIPQTSKKYTALNIDNYIAVIKSIIDVLENNNPTLWNETSKLKFEQLDYFLWHIGKAGKESYSLLLTKNEIRACYKNRKIIKLPKRIHIWQYIYNKIIK